MRLPGMNATVNHDVFAVHVVIHDPTACVSRSMVTDDKHMLSRVLSLDVLTPHHPELSVHPVLFLELNKCFSRPTEVVVLVPHQNHQWRPDDFLKPFSIESLCGGRPPNLFY